jgi:hypothetical protein
MKRVRRRCISARYTRYKTRRHKSVSSYGSERPWRLATIHVHARFRRRSLRFVDDTRGTSIARKVREIPRPSARPGAERCRLTDTTMSLRGNRGTRKPRAYRCAITIKDPPGFRVAPGARRSVFDRAFDDRSPVDRCPIRVGYGYFETIPYRRYTRELSLGDGVSGDKKKKKNSPRNAILAHENAENTYRVGGPRLIA